MKRIRVGAVGYTNAWPLTTRLDRIRYQASEDHPAEVARKLQAGEVDVGLVPVAAVLNDGDYKVLPGWCIGADGPVRSVVLAGTCPPEEWTEVLLDGVSRTSVVLAKLLLKDGPWKRLDVRVRIVPPTTALDKAGGTVAALVIGDAARHLPGQFRFELDLAEAWTEWTGLPFVFAVWAGRPDLTLEDLSGLRSAAAEGMALRSALSEPERTYLTEDIRYQLDDRAMMGLRRFAALGARAGLLRQTELRLYAPPGRIRPRRPDTDTLLARGAAGERLGFDEALQLYDAPLSDLGTAANLRRWALHPTDDVTYIISRNINYTNVCVTACKFCSFYRPKNHREAYVLTQQQVHDKCDELVRAGGIEVLLQGGLHRELGIDYYERLFRYIKANFPLDLHALSPEEVFHVMKISDLSMDETLDRLAAAGMDSLPGGGAEVLVDSIRKQIAPLKCTTQQWLDVMEAAHQRGMTSSATLMFGMMETPAHRIEHLLRLRDLQDRTNGFVAFICWTFQPEHNYVEPGDNTAGDYLRVNALSRLVLDSFRNLQASWVTQGPGIAQASLHMGCNDFGSVMMEENVVSAAGTTFQMSVADVERNVREAGFTPVRRNASYDYVGAAITPSRQVRRSPELTAK